MAERVVFRAVVLAAALGGCGSKGLQATGPDANIDAMTGEAAREAAVAPDAAAADQRVSDAALAEAASDVGEISDAIPMRCNGHAALCDRRFSEVVFPATHNSMSSADDGWIAPNQIHDIKRQLEDGIRALLIDTHSFLGGSYLCHGFCAIGSRPLVDGLRDVASFLRANPHEVLALIIEDGISAADTEAAFKTSGLAELVYTHNGGPWPTLRQMISLGQRLLVSAERGRPPPAWYHHVWDLAWDTPYSFKSKDDFSCALNRGSRGHPLFLLNHWLENPLPTQGLSAIANAREVLLGRARQCQSESGKLPNFVAVNHYSVGSLFEVVRTLNGL